MSNRNKKPKCADYYNWEDFAIWAVEKGINLEHIDDYDLFWKCWIKGYCSAIHSDNKL